MKSSIGLYYQLIVKDKSGKVVSKTPFRRSKSFLLQFLQIIEVQSFRVNVNITDYTTVVRSVPAHAQSLNFASAVGSVTTGILVGTGTTTPTNLDTAMETLIAHGVGAGQLSYGALSITTTAEVGANVDYIATRTFNNGSGNAINVTEAGIVMDGGTWHFFCVHDVFSTVVVLNSQTLTVNYTLRTTV